MFCFTIILNIFLSFVTCSMHKNPHQNARNGIKETLFFKIFPRSIPRTPLAVLAPSARLGQIRVRPPPKFLSPYAYDEIGLNNSSNFAYFSGLVLQTDENANVGVKLEMWNDDPKQLWDFVPVGKNTPSEERISLLSTTTEIE